MFIELRPGIDFDITDHILLRYGELSRFHGSPSPYSLNICSVLYLLCQEYEAFILFRIFSQRR